MARPSHQFAYADGTPELELLGAATSGDIALLERMARQLDGGRGRIAEAVEAVKDHGAGALHLAAAGGSAEVCEYLVEDVRVNIDARDIAGRTPLVYAITCEGGHPDTVRYLLDHGANPDNVDIQGFTPLHEAAKKGHCEVVKLLLSRGAHVDTFSTDHGTPLHVAVKHQQDDAMNILLDHHADCNKILKDFCSPLTIAIHNRSVKCVNLLLEAGADVKGMHGTTPLQVAIAYGVTDVLKPLLDAGADPNLRDEDSVMHIANSLGRKPVAVSRHATTLWIRTNSSYDLLLGRNGALLFGQLPIQSAACLGTRKDVEILFEVTSRIPAIPDWSVDGITSYIKSQPKLEDLPLYKMSRAKLTQEGHKALVREDYNAAVEFYTMANVVDPENMDPNLISMRGLCRLRLGNAEGAFNDGQHCRTMEPDNPYACWLQGYAYVLLKEYEKACDAFLDGLKLKPEHVGIEKALREGLRLLKESYTDKKNGIEGRDLDARMFL